jgi:uncharacterized membrane protein YfcA
MAIGEREKRIRIASAVSLLAACVAGILIGLLSGQAPHIPQLAVGLLAAAILFGAFMAMVPRWRRLDHMQQDSRLRSWYWGGGFAGGLGLVLALIFGGARSPLFAGAALVWLLQCAGYGASRLNWWRVHRAEAA